MQHLLDHVPAKVASRVSCVDRASAAAAENLRTLASNRAAVERLLAMPPLRAVEQVLQMAHVFDTAPHRVRGLAVQVERVLGPAKLLALALDVLLGRPRNVGAVLVARIKRATAGKGDLLTRCRAGWPLLRLVEAVGEDPEGGRRTPKAVESAPYSQHAEDRAATDEQALLDFAVGGHWRMVAYTLARPVARERGWSPAWLSDRSGVPESAIEAGLAAARTRATA